jgi:predicted RNA binding protein YcfA (HicA-like mRNA interferase family)
VKSVSGKEMCRALERKGWNLKRIRGSHHIYGHDDDPATIIPVPVHGNKMLRRGTQHTIMKAAGLTEDDL